MNNYALALLPMGMTSAMAQQKPNILVIIADDMGRCELGCYGGQNLGCRGCISQTGRRSA